MSAREALGRGPTHLGLRPGPARVEPAHEEAHEGKVRGRARGRGEVRGHVQFRVGAEEIREQAQAHVLVRPRLAGAAAVAVHVDLVQVRERAVAEVVHEARELDAQDVVVVHPVRVARAELPRERGGEVRDAEGVLAPRVRRGRVHERAAPQLADAVEAKKVGRGRDGRREGRQLDLPVDSVSHAPRVHLARNGAWHEGILTHFLITVYSLNVPMTLKLFRNKFPMSLTSPTWIGKSSKRSGGSLSSPMFHDNTSMFNAPTTNKTSTIFTRTFPNVGVYLFTCDSNLYRAARDTRK